MTSTKNTERDLVVRQWPWFMWVLGLIFVGAGGLLAATQTEQTTLLCQRGTGECTVSVVRPFGADETRSFDISHLQGAELRLKQSRGGMSYGLNLVVRGHRMALTEKYRSSRRARDQTIEEINSFVADSEESMLRVVEDDRWFGLVSGVLFIALGLVVFVQGRIGQYRFSRHKRGLAIGTRGLLGREDREIPFDHIDRVRVGSMGNGRNSYRVEVVLHDGEAISLPTSFVFRARADRLQRKVSSFLGRRESGEKIEPKGVSLFPDPDDEVSSGPGEVAGDVEGGARREYGDFDSPSDW